MNTKEILNVHEHSFDTFSSPSDDEEIENKENIDPKDISSMKTPLKIPVHPWRSNKRTPLGDISRFFCVKEPKVLNLLYPQDELNFNKGNHYSKNLSDTKNIPAFKFFR